MSSCTFDTIWPADSVEFCPHPDVFNLFVCGTYNLEKNEDSAAEESDPSRKRQVRRGKCALVEVNGGDKLCGNRFIWGADADSSPG